MRLLIIALFSIVLFSQASAQTSYPTLNTSVQLKQSFNTTIKQAPYSREATVDTRKHYLYFQRPNNNLTSQERLQNPNNEIYY